MVGSKGAGKWGRWCRWLATRRSRIWQKRPEQQSRVGNPNNGPQWNAADLGRFSHRIQQEISQSTKLSRFAVSLGTEMVTSYQSRKRYSYIGVPGPFMGLAIAAFTTPLSAQRVQATRCARGVVSRTPAFRLHLSLPYDLCCAGLKVVEARNQ